ISRLKAAALEIGRGKLDTRIDITARDEVGDLAGSFRRMAGDLQKITVSRDYMDSIITSMLDSLIVVTPAGTISRVNPATCELLEYEEEELLNESVAKVFGTPSPLEGPVYEELMQQGIIRNVESMYRAKDGRMIPVLFSGSVMRNTDGAVQGVVCVAQDMTIRKKMEEELIKSEKLQSVGLLAGGIAHDFNNFLAIASGNVELLKESMQHDEGGYKRVMEAEKALHRAEKLTHQLLTFSRGGAPLRKATSIGELVKESACFPVRGTSVQCEQDLPIDLWPVEVDEGQISQVINNLVMNAVQAMPEGGTIQVDCENVTIHEGDVPNLGAGDYVKISIRDDGPGIPKENLKKIFDPYFTTKTMGSGLGLAICYSVVRNHDGLIAVESEEGQGTTFSLYLPISRKTYREKTDEEETTFTGTGTILFMDDEEAVRMMAGDVLKSLGYEVEFARDGTEAIVLYEKAHASGTPFAAVILDLTIPGGMGGKETIRRLRELDPQVKAIVSSGYSNDPVMANFRQHGFSGVVAKPYRKQDMGKTLYEVIQGTRKAG
ncbi:MAG TPA: hybrid sensor histidine kinase/response regulator, partial [Nitrospiraceae bacterium]|nr:hybrid sensor histidine kinase/response regulator [Nitrospiraceae bacterium]